MACNAKSSLKKLVDKKPQIVYIMYINSITTLKMTPQGAEPYL